MGWLKTVESARACQGVIAALPVANMFAKDTAVNSAWAWLGDMEVDDMLLGLGVAGVFKQTAPLAVGFLVNGAHSVEMDSVSRKLKATPMLKRKRRLLDTFFHGRFYAVLDRYAVGCTGCHTLELSPEELNAIGPTCGFEDELKDWLGCVVDGSMGLAVVNIIISGPLLGRGQEIFTALRNGVLATGPGTPSRKIVFWLYAGTFNLRHSSEADIEELGKLADDFNDAVTVVETTLKSGSWICRPAMPFWGSVCPTAWSVSDAKNNPVGFDVSTDIQSVNVFLERYSLSKKGLTQIFKEAGANELLNELEWDSLVTNLTMMAPTSASMAKLREHLGLSEEALAVAYERTAPFVDQDEGDIPGDLAALKAAARDYAELYAGPDGRFIEAGCQECFPVERPYGGPRLDKRCMLRCMAAGLHQGGPTADFLTVFALLLFATDVEAHDVHIALPQSTRDLFKLEKTGPEGRGQAFTAVCRADLKMDDVTEGALAPLVDAGIAALLNGAAALKAAPGEWGTAHG